MAFKTKSGSKKNLIIGVVVILFAVLMLFFVFGGDTNDSSGDSSDNSGQTYSVTSDTNEVIGEVLVRSEDSQDGSGTIAYVYIIKDELANNGKCIDAGEPFCANRTDDGLAKAESIKYQYSLVLDGLTSNEGGPVGTYLEAVYCNQEVLESNPMGASNIVSDTTLDVRCGKDYNYSTWQPTTTFVARNGSSVQSLDDVKNLKTLSLYDTSNLHKTKYTTTSNSGTAEQIVPSLEEAVSNGVLVRTYTVVVE